MAKHNIMVKATSLGNVRGRIDYISNPERQENLMAVHSSADRKFWIDLSKHCQERANLHMPDPDKKAVEGREFMVALANELSEIDPDELAKKASDKLKELTGTENVVAVHWNKAKNNFHIHFITSENEENQIKEGAVLRQNTYFDAEGKRSTKKNCIDSEGNLKPGCTFVKKGERKVTEQRFGPKIEKIKSKAFLLEFKKEMAVWQNELLKEERFRMFDRSLYIAQQHVGKNTTSEQAEAIKAKNALIRSFNEHVDKHLDLVAKKAPTHESEALESLKSVRDDVKEHALTSEWINRIQIYLNKIISAMRELEKLPDRKKSFDAQIADSEAEKKKPEAEGEYIRRKTDQGSAGVCWDDRF